MNRDRPVVDEYNREEIMMANQLPTSADVRKARSRGREAVRDRFDVVRTPLLAWIGAGDYALHRLGELPTEARERLNGDELRRRFDEVSARARKTYAELADRGEDTLERIQNQPQVARVLRNTETANRRVNRRVENAVDEAHDATEDAKARVSTETRSVGERTARATQRNASAAAARVEKAGGDAAASVKEAGDEAARATRSTTRKAANRTQPERNGR